MKPVDLSRFFIPIYSAINTDGWATAIKKYPIRGRFIRFMATHEYLQGNPSGPITSVILPEPKTRYRAFFTGTTALLFCQLFAEFPSFAEGYKTIYALLLMGLTLLSYSCMTASIAYDALLRRERLREVEEEIELAEETEEYRRQLITRPDPQAGTLQ